MNVDLVKFASNHLDDAASLYVSVFNSPPWNDHWTFYTARQRLSEILDTPNSFGCSVVFDGELLGFGLGYCEQWFDSGHYYLKEMCIKQDYQGRGLGKALLRWIEEAMVDAGDVDRIYLLTARGDRAEGFYTRLGYRASPRMIMMSRKLR